MSAAIGLTEPSAYPTAQGPPSAKPRCHPQSPGPVQGAQMDPAQPLCGSKKPDRLVSHHGHNIEAFNGDDVICANNGLKDDIWGGPEDYQGDKAYVDAEDLKGARSPAAWGRSHDIEVVATKPTKWSRAARCPTGRGRSSSAVAQRRAQEPLRGPAYGPIVYCDQAADTPQKWRMWFPHEPQIRAADQGSGTQWQTVAWSAVAYILRGTEWVEYAQTIWLWDRTFEEGAKKPFIGHYWRRYAGNRDRRFVSITPREPGTFRMEIKYHWYKEAPRAPTYGFQVGDDPHVGPNETDQTHTSCTFPAVTPQPPPPPPPGTGAATAATTGGSLRLDLALLGDLPSPRPKLVSP